MGFRRAHFQSWVKLWEVVWSTFQLKSARPELKESSHGGRRFGLGSSTTDEEEGSSFKMKSLAGAVGVFTGADLTC